MSASPSPSGDVASPAALRKRIRDLEQLAATNEQILDSISDGFFAVDKEWRMVYVNRRGEKLFRKSREQMLGVSLWTSFPDAVGTVFDEKYRWSFLHQQPLQFEAYYEPFDIWVDVRTHPSEALLSVYFLDITHRKRQEAERLLLIDRGRELAAQLEQASSERDEILARLDSFLMPAPVGIAFLDTDMRFVFVNEALAKMNGVPAVDHVGRKIAEVVPELAAQAEPLVREAMLARKPLVNVEIAGETPLRRGDQRYWLESFYPVFAHERLLGTGIFVSEVTERKRTELQLQEANELLRVAQRSARAGVWDWDLETNAVEWSPEFLELYGLDPESAEHSVETWVAALHPGDRARVGKEVREAIEQQDEARFEFRIVRRDGVRWINSLGRIARDAEGRAVRMTGLAVDVTDRRTAEDLLQLHLENTPVAVVEYSADFRITRWSSEAERIFGWPSEEVIGKRFDDLRWIYEQDVPAISSLVADMVAGRKARMLSPNRNYTKDGRVVWMEWFNSALFDASGQLESVMCFGVDVTERKRIELALRESEATLESVFNSSPLMMGLVELDGDDIVHLYDNRAAELFFGVAAQVTRNRRASELGVSPSAVAMWRGQYERAKELAQPVAFNYGHELNGAMRRLSTVVSYIGVSASGRDRFCYVTEDVTERSESETRLRASEERWQYALQAIEAGVWDWDLQTNHVFYSARWLETLGLSPGLHAHTRDLWLDRLHPDDLERATTAMENHLRGAAPAFESEHRLRHADGSFRWVQDRAVAIRDQFGVPVRVVGSQTDVTGRKRSEQRQAFLVEAGLLLAGAMDAESALRALAELAVRTIADVCRIEMSDAPPVITVSGTANVSAEEVTASFAGVPILVQGRMVGALKVHSLEHGRFSPDDVAVLAEVARRLGAALETWRLYNSVKESETRLRSILDSAPSPVYIRDLAGRTQFLNRAFLELLGDVDNEYAPSELTLKLREDDEVAIREGSLQAEKALPTRRGERIFQIIKFPLFGLDGAPYAVCGIATDMTESRRAERRIAQLAESLALSQQAGQVGSFDWDVPSGTVTWSKQLEALYGLPEGGFHGRYRDWERQILPDDLPGAVGALRAALAVCGSFDFRYRIRRADGPVRHIQALGRFYPGPNGKPLRGAGVNLDVTDRVAYEQALQASEERYRTLAEAAPQMVFTATPAGEVDFWNLQWERYAGAAAGSWLEAVHAEDRPAGVESWNEAVANGSAFEAQLRLRDAEGRYRWFLCRAVPLRDGTAIVRWFGTCTDIQQQKETENELRRANIDLNQFAYAASHDLREPLRQISTFTQLLVRSFQGNLDPKAQDYMGFITQSCQRMTTLLKDLLTYTETSRTLDPLTAKADCEAALSEAERNLAGQAAEANASITHDPLPEVSCHAVNLVLLFQNLLSNALKYRNPELPPHVHVSVTREDGYYRFAVADNGQGIDPKYHAMVFGVFRRLHGKDVPGTGIGLAICQRIVERYGGSIWVESEAGSGATILFTLPA